MVCGSACAGLCGKRACVCVCVHMCVCVHVHVQSACIIYVFLCVCSTYMYLVSNVASTTVTVVAKTAEAAQRMAT